MLVNPRLVRGLDYYTDTVFEFVPRAGTTGVGTQSTVLAGGSYGHLVSELGGPPGVVGAGWSAGLDRLALLLVRGQLAQPRLSRARLVACPRKSFNLENSGGSMGGGRKRSTLRVALWRMLRLHTWQSSPWVTTLALRAWQ